MNIFFKKCTDAVNHTVQTKTYGVFYSSENTPNYNIHTHDCCEILFCLSGGKNFLIDDKVYEISDGDVFISNQFEAHKITFRDIDTVERYVIQIHPEFLFLSSTGDTNLTQCFYERNKNTTNQLSLSADEQKHLLSLLKKLSENYSFGDDVMKKTIVMQILVFLNEKFISHHNFSDSSEFNSEQLKSAILYINEHLSEKLTLEDIAKNSYISVNQLCKIFKLNLGTTVVKYITGKRISEAKKYLKSGYNVSDTAFMCGFQDYSIFIRTFTNAVGISPGKYSKSE